MSQLEPPAEADLHYGDRILRAGSSTMSKGLWAGWQDLGGLDFPVYPKGSIPCKFGVS